MTPVLDRITPPWHLCQTVSLHHDTCLRPCLHHDTCVRPDHSIWHLCQNMSLNHDTCIRLGWSTMTHFRPCHSTMTPVSDCVTPSDTCVRQSHSIWHLCQTVTPSWHLWQTMSLHHDTGVMSRHVLQCCSSASSPSLWRPSPWPLSLLYLTTGWRSAWTPTSLCVRRVGRWQRRHRTLEFGSPSLMPLHSWPSSAM